MTSSAERQGRQRRQEVAVGALLVAAALLLGWMAVRLGALGVPGSAITVEARFDHAGGVKAGSPVMVAGVDVGVVRGLRVEAFGAVATLDVAADLGLPSAVRADIRARSVLGEKYVELVPLAEGGPLLADGHVITVTRGAVEMDELVNAMGPLLDAVDPEALARAVAALTRALDEDPERLGRMLADAEQALSTHATLAHDATTLVADVRGAVGELRATLRRLDPALKAAPGLVAEAEAALADVRKAMEPLGQSAAHLPALLDDAQAALAEVRAGLAPITSDPARLDRILDNVEELDKWELRRLLREEGIKVRLIPAHVEVPEEER